MTDLGNTLAGLLRSADEGLVCTSEHKIIFMSGKAKALVGDFTGRDDFTLFEPELLAVAPGEELTTRLNGHPVTVRADVYEGCRMYYIVSLLVPGKYIQLSPLEEAQVRANLNDLRIASDNALQGADNRALRRSLESVKHNSSKIERTLVSNSLLGRLSQGDEPVKPVSLDMGCFLADVLDPVIGLAVGRGVSLEYSLGTNLCAVVDPELTAKLILELLCNLLMGIEDEGKIMVKALRRGDMVALYFDSSATSDSDGLRLASAIAIAQGGSLLSTTGPDTSHYCCTVPAGSADAALGSEDNFGLSPSQIFSRVMIQLSPWLHSEDYDYRLF